MSVTELKRLKQLEDENLRLKRMYASLSKAIPNDKGTGHYDQS